jgi:hypothetical protein
MKYLLFVLPMLVGCASMPNQTVSCPHETAPYTETPHGGSETLNNVNNFLVGLNDMLDPNHDICTRRDRPVVEHNGKTFNLVQSPYGNYYQRSH